MTVLKLYLKSRAELAGLSESEYNKKVQEVINLRNSFSKSDWKELIAQSTGRAKYEYTRMMRERFGE